MAQGTEQELSKGSGAAVEVEVVGAAAKAKAALAGVDGVGGVEVVRSDERESLLRVQVTGEHRPAIIRALVQGGVDVLRVDRAASQLESIFMQLTQTRSA